MSTQLTDSYILFTIQFVLYSTTKTKISLTPYNSISTATLLVSFIHKFTLITGAKYEYLK